MGRVIGPGVCWLAVLLLAERAQGQAPIERLYPGCSVASANRGFTLGDFNSDGWLDLAGAPLAEIHASPKIQVRLGGPAGFGPPADFATAAVWADRIKVTDLDNDGREDLVVVHTAEVNKQLSVLIGDGAGGFAPPMVFGVGGHPYGVALADLDHDGNQDLVAADAVDNRLSVLLGDGLGGLYVHALIPVAGEPIDLALGDLNGDSNLDIVTVNDFSLTPFTTVLLGDGTGGFTQIGTHVQGSRSQSVVLTDLDGDTRLDVLSACNNTNAIGVLKGDGLGGFAPISFISMGSRPFNLALADIDHDGRTDLLTSNTSSDSISYRRGLGLGAFAPTILFPAGRYPATLATGDIDRDGWPDLLCGSVTTCDVQVFYGDRKGGLEHGRSIPVHAGGFALALGDVDLDGNLDAVLGHSGTSVDWLRGNGVGGFVAAGSVQPGGFPTGIALRDFTGDGRPDLAVSVESAGLVSVFIGNGGGFGPATSYAAGVRPLGIAIGDLDGDSLLDLATAEFGSGDVAVFHGNGSGVFSPPVFVPVAPSVSGVVLADVNLDSRLDLIVLDAFKGLFYVVLANAGGGFGVPTRWSVGPGLASIATADFNLDGKPDVAAAADKVTIYLGDGAGGFAAAWTSNGSLAYPSRLAVCDANRDGRGDLAVADTYDSRIVLLLGDGQGGFTDELHLAGGTEPNALAAGDLDHDLWPDLVFANATSADLVTLLNGHGHTVTTYCRAKQNSLGCVPSITTSGAPMASAIAGFDIRCDNVRNNTRGLLLYGFIGSATIPFQGGYLCLSAPFQRTPQVSSGGNPAPANDCSGAYSIEFNCFAAGLCGGNPPAPLSMPGTVVNCQWWGRDPGFPAPLNSTLSDAVEFTIRP